MTEEERKLSRRNPETVYRVIRNANGGRTFEPEPGSNLQELDWRGVPSWTTRRHKNGKEI